ncbi:MAG: hypothetical protein COU81_02155 [Candidatus Portnoybacteria bacterium CG10_big_fil_rev_8_21_14_0_10_36_7]|uniref:LTD domain-containing protein n=1 Tax=Candidatus Portnoybacteria bacterium CG10_big_fil_rev_8_21_14_0_10_36_7 TaxID=1974812 RepID=A0A2M8KE53_9BACT|nr:MAG: hypothetical protein COU81_02155 [Candidatus Portnoybacteria bacterium CG10_big_fil_rev_8_21_14_0_10_36_7]
MDKFCILPIVMIITGLSLGAIGLANNLNNNANKLEVIEINKTNYGSGISSPGNLTVSKKNEPTILALTPNTQIEIAVAGASTSPLSSIIEEIYVYKNEIVSGVSLSPIIEEEFHYNFNKKNKEIAVIDDPLETTEFDVDTPVVVEPDSAPIYSPPPAISLPPSTPDESPEEIIVPPVEATSTAQLMINNFEVYDISNKGAKIFWQTNLDATSSILFGTSTEYNLIVESTTATTSLDIVLDNLMPDQDYHIKLSVVASDGQSISTEDAIFHTTDKANYVVISEIKISGETVSDEWIELYNPTGNIVDLSGWSLKRKSKSGSEYNLVSSGSFAGSIWAHGYFLITHKIDYMGTTTADLFYSSKSYAVASNNTVLLYDNNDLLVDKVGYGEANDFEEYVFSENPDSQQSLERKAQKSATAESMALGGADELSGNALDTDNNFSDFILQDNPSPQNSEFVSESI